MRQKLSRLVQIAGPITVAFVLTFALLLSQSRGAWLGIASATVLLSFLRWRWARIAGVAAALAGTAWFLWRQPWVGAGQGTLLGDMVGIGGGLSLGGRVELWGRAIAGIEDFPLTGMGMDMFRQAVHVLYPLFTISSSHDAVSAHNRFLQTALDLGIPGLVADTGLWAGAFALLWKVWRRESGTWRQTLALGLLAGWAAHLVYQMMDAVPFGAKVGVFWWVALAVAVSMFRLEFPHWKPALARWELALWWLLVSLTAVVLMDRHSFCALALAAGGGVLVGLAAVAGRDGCS